MRIRLMIVLLGLLVVVPGTAQPVLEEIVVTARKTVESLDDVPISVAVISGDKLDQMSISGLEELSGAMPNLQVNENATQQTVTIRGIGSGANQAFEQSVGTFIDGVYFGRGRSARNPFFDMERIEVLRGPQGILFGKNTIAGAINITTRKPTDEFEAHIHGEYFDEIDQWGISAAVSGPLSDRIRGRLAARTVSSDGFMKNSFTGEDESGRDEYIVRGLLAFDISDTLDLMLKAEVAKYDVDGRNSQNVQAGPLGGLYEAFDSSFESDLDYNKSTPGDDFDNTETGNFTATLNWEPSDEWTFTSITSFVSYEFDNNIPAEFAPVPDYAEQSNEQEHDQFAQELRALYNSPGGRMQIVGGIYWQQEELSIEETFNFQLTNLINVGVGLFPLDSSIITFYDQDTDSFAAFTEVRYNITESLTGSMGLRYTKDEKDVDKELLVASLGTQTRNPGMEPFAAIIGRIPHAYDLSREDTETSPAFGLQWHVSKDSMLYVSYSEGFKAGGFDAQNTAGMLALAEFDPEEAEAWEVGGKFTLADGRVKLNLAYFDNEFTDLQVAAFNGLVFSTTNAASASSSGLELDVQWLALEAFTVGLNAAWLDAEYDDFPGSTCTAPQQNAHAAATGNPPGSCIQDLSGNDLQFSPDFAANLNAVYETQIGENLVLTIQGEVNHSSSYFTAQDLDPLSEQNSYTKLNARVALASQQGGWSIALVGKNLTDEETTTWVNDVPVFRGAYFGFIDPPRTVGVQVQFAIH